MDEDVDIMTERQRVAEGDADQDTLCLKNLHKTYGSKVNIREDTAIRCPAASARHAWDPEAYMTASLAAPKHGNPRQTACPDRWVGWQ